MVGYGGGMREGMRVVVAAEDAERELTAGVREEGGVGEEAAARLETEREQEER